MLTQAQPAASRQLDPEPSPNKSTSHFFISRRFNSSSNVSVSIDVSFCGFSEGCTFGDFAFDLFEFFTSLYDLICGDGDLLP